MLVLSDDESTISADQLLLEESSCWRADEDLRTVNEFMEPLHQTIEKVERELIMKALVKAGSTRKAAELLGINQATVSRKAKQLGISCEAPKNKWRKERL